MTVSVSDIVTISETPGTQIMGITNGYTTVDKLKARLFSSNFDAQSEDADEAALESVIEGVSRAIDRIKNRVFYMTTATRYYTADNQHRVKIDDLISLTSLKTDDDGDMVYETTWATTDYRLFPFNGGVSGNPYLEIIKSPYGVNLFPSYDGAVEIVGSFGYGTTVPKEISEACLLGSMRLWGRRDLVYGVSGNADLGTLAVVASLKKDGEFMLMLDAVPTRLVY